MTLALFVALSPLSYSQSPSDPVDPENLNHELLEKLVAKKINQVRKRRGRSHLPYSSYLHVYSRKHSNTIVESGNFQHSDIFSDPAVNGECLAYKGSDHFHKDTYDELAEEMVQGWLDSPGHRDIMLEKRAKQQGVGVSLGKRKVRNIELPTIYFTFTITTRTW